VTALALAAALLASTSSTAYCLHGQMADGTYTRAGSIAHNGYPLGTRVTVWPSPTGGRRFVVRDRIGWGTQLDFWLDSCTAALAWGRRAVHVRRGWSRPWMTWRAHRPRRHRARLLEPCCPAGG
jgi:3D (Asp-Asp-Asp) domain-containing protein